MGSYVGAGLATNLNFSSGVLGAKADWSTNLPINLPNGGNINFRAADPADVAHNISLNGVLAGNGGVTKSGGGSLALRATNTFAGAVTINGGTLEVDGSIAQPGTWLQLTPGRCSPETVRSIATSS